MDSGDQNTPESTAREMKKLKRGGFGTPYSALYKFLSFTRF